MTEAALPAISVVIPTFNRLARLKRVLDALSQQTLDEREFEVIVVSDGCTDGTDEYLSDTTPLPVVHAPPGQRRSRRCTQSRRSARSWSPDPLPRRRRACDADTGPAPCEAHGDSTSTVVIGPMLNAPGFGYSPWVAWEQAKLYKQYEAMRLGVYSADVPPVLHRQRVGSARAGGRGGWIRHRLPTGRGHRVVVPPRPARRDLRVRRDGATAHHLAERSFESWIAAAAAYGRNDVTFARDHDQQWLLPVMAVEFRQRSPSDSAPRSPLCDPAADRGVLQTSC